MGDSEREPTPGLAIDIRKVSCLYGAVRAVDDLSITIPAGEFVSLLGPSGSGKTTLLMAIAGFQNIASGSICIGGKDISHSPPHKRDLGVVFQRYALFPHMNVTENIEYALRMRGVPSKRREKVTKNTLELVGLQELRDRRPAQLSGGSNNASLWPGSWFTSHRSFSSMNHSAPSIENCDSRCNSSSGA